jgi:ketosteroid isomerase-like protein
MGDDVDPELLEANARFYRAFEALDVEAMDAVWRHDGRVKCVHPGWPLLSGWEAVRGSWEAIFASTAEMRFTLSELSTTRAGDFGWVTCTENIIAEVQDRVSVTAVLATNLFERGPDGWRMALHHASHVLARPSG